MNPELLSLLPLAQAGGVYAAFTGSDLLGKIICVFLFLFSMAIWVVMLEKIISLLQMSRHSTAFVRQFREKRNPLALREKVNADPSPAARVFQSACDRVAMFHIETDGGRRALSDDELEVVRSAMAQAVEEQILVAEKRMMFLATAVSASPFLGLFGTVWGITLAFTNLAASGNASIQTLAPGVSGALLTTVVALLVAIPSLVGYNCIASFIKRMTVQMDNFSEEISARLKIEQLDALSKAGRPQ